MTDSTDPLNEGLVKTQLGAAYNRFDVKERVRHLELLRSIQKPENVALDIEVGKENNWIVTVCTSDCIGALSTIAGLLAAYRLDILSVDVFTLSLPYNSTESTVRPRRKRRSQRARSAVEPGRLNRRILDIFEVRALDGFNSPSWERYQEELEGLFALLVKGQQELVREQIIDRVSEAARSLDDAEPQLFPMTVAPSNDASQLYTKLAIRSTDTPGFLFAFTNAITMLNVNIERAEVRTVGGEVYDTFWLTDSSGRKIVAEERLQELRVAAALIKHFTHLLPRSPNPSQGLRQFNALTRQMLSNPDWANELRDLESTEVLETLADMMGVSRFLWEDFLRMQHENLFPVLLDTLSLDIYSPKEQLRDCCRHQLRSPTDRGDEVQKLNRFKDREMFRIDLRHITGRIGFRDFAGEMSDLAEVVVEEAAELARKMLESQFGIPTLAGGQPCPWCVCALGKFGGRELGFGSDIEIIFVYEREGVTNGPTAIENSRYFGELVRTFLTTLTARREGIFEVDLRLRPYGNAGPLASTLDVFSDYYSDEGSARQFERMAMIKLRPVAGDSELGHKILRSRDEFVYSGRPLDKENILHLRRRQAEELVRPGTVNAKYSPGGLVEIEYFVQAWQTAVGHLDARVRVGNTIDAISRLADGGHMRSERTGELRETAD